MTKRKSTVTADFIAPILVLTVICLVISGALALTNSVTAPVIEETARRINEQARLEVLPAADGFELLQTQDLPETVTEVYKATNGAGYVFMITCDGYGGKDTMHLICGMDADGVIVRCKTISHSETAGLGSKTADASFSDQFTGKNAALDGVTAISGATRSSDYYINAIRDCFAAYEQVKEAA